MSKTKLIEGIEGTLTGKKVVFNPIADYSFKVVENPDRKIDFRSGTEYKVEIRLGAAEFISDELFNKSIQDSNMLIQETKARIGRSISNYVYGHVQQKLIDITDEVRYRYPANRELIDKLYETIRMMDYD
jgi:predicted DNA-binding antitoxin AbrB/MazE fold protein